MKLSITQKDIFYVSFILIIFILTYLFKGCDNKPKIVVDKSKEIELQKTVGYYYNYSKQIKPELDSLRKLKPIYIKDRDRVRDSLIYVSDSICDNNLNALYNECRKVDSLNNYMIAKQSIIMENDSHVISGLNGIISLKNIRISSDSIEIKELNKSIKKEKVKGKFSTIIAVIAVVGIGSLIK